MINEINRKEIRVVAYYLLYAISLVMIELTKLSFPTMTQTHTEYEIAEKCCLSRFQDRCLLCCRARTHARLVVCLLDTDFALTDRSTLLSYLNTCFSSISSVGTSLELFQNVLSIPLQVSIYRRICMVDTDNINKQHLHYFTRLDVVNFLSVFIMFITIV